jgi:Immunity protein 53
MNELIIWLQKWYQSQCNGDWEHSYGITIQTLDNPGWSLFVNLDETVMEDRSFQPIRVERTEDNWVFCEVKNNRFEGACSPLNLVEVLEIFHNWVTSDDSAN